MLRLLLVFTLFTFTRFLSFSQEVLPIEWGPTAPVHAFEKYENKIIVGGVYPSVSLRLGNAVPVLKESGDPIKGFPYVNGVVNCIVDDGNGGWYLGGSFTKVGDFFRSNIAHVSGDFKVTSWAPEVNGPVNTVAVGPNSVFIGGDFNYVSGQQRASFVEVNKETGDLSSFQPNPDGAVLSILKDNNTLYIGGEFEEIAGAIKTGTAAFNLSDRKLKPWNPVLSKGTHPLFVSEIKRVDSTVFLGGHFYSANGQKLSNIVGVDTSSGSEAHFLINEFQDDLHYEINSIEINDSTVFAGLNILKGFSDTPTLRAYDRKSLESKKMPGVTNEVTCLKLLKDKLFISRGESFLENENIDRFFSIDLKTYNVQTVTSSFQYNSYINDFVLNGDTVLTGGVGLNTFFGLPKKRIAVYDASTFELQDLNINVEGAVYSLEENNNFLFIGGLIPDINGQLVNSLAKYDLSNDQLTGWDVGLSATCTNSGFVTIKETLVNGSLIYVTGDFSIVNNTYLSSLGYTPGVAAFDINTGEISQNWKPKITSSGGFVDSCNQNLVQTIEKVNNNLLIGGEFKFVGEKEKNGLALISAKTGALIPWGPDLPEGSYVSEIVVKNDTVYIAGKFEAVGAFPRHNFAVLDTTGAVLDIAPVFDNSVNQISVDGNTVYAIGDFSSVNGKPISKGVLINRFDGKVKPLLSESGPYLINEVAVFDNIVYLGGSLSNVFEKSPFLVRLKPTDISLSYKISGRIFTDQNQDCEYNEGDKPFRNVLVKLEPSDELTTTDGEGVYNFFVSDTGKYQVEQVPGRVLKNLNFSTLCPSDLNTIDVHVSGNQLVLDSLDFAGVMPKCSYLSIDIASNRRRRCFRNSTSVKYCNNGNLVSESPEIKVIFPEYVVPVSSSVTWNDRKGDTLVFNVEPLLPGECRTILIEDSVSCESEEILGYTQCTEAIISPSNRCVLISPEWDKSDLNFEAVCKDNGFVRVKLNNMGSGSMTDSSFVSIFLDAALAFTKNVKLAKGDSLIFSIPANGRTVRAEADQTPFHPDGGKTSVTIEACKVLNSTPASQGFKAAFEEDDWGEAIESHCLPIIGSYDPNDKNVHPLGLFDEHYIKGTEELEYLIRFKNKGTDTAFTVVIIDTLSPHFDLSTLVTGASSHLYTYKVTGNNKPVLTFRFNDINLVDSITNDAKSGGFVKFKITPKAGLPEETVISNKAGIYFDYNSPVITNEVRQVVKDTSLSDPDPSLTGTIKQGELYTLCVGDSVKIQNLPVGDSYSWSPENAIINPKSKSPVFYPETTQEYILTLESEGVKKEIPYTFVVSPFSDITLSTDTTINKGDTITISANAENSDFLGWSPVKSVEQKASVFSKVYPEQTVFYSATFKNQYGCIKADSLKVTVLEVSALKDKSFNGVVVQVTPNPFKQKAEFLINGLDKIGKGGVITVSIYEANGKKVKELTAKDFNSEIRIPFDFNLKSGLYYFTIKNQQAILGSGKLIAN